MRPFPGAACDARGVDFGGAGAGGRSPGPVEPGDILELECELINRRGPLGIGKGVAKVNGRVAAAAELSFAIGE